MLHMISFPKSFVATLLLLENVVSPHLLGIKFKIKPDAGRQLTVHVDILGPSRLKHDRSGFAILFS